MIFSKGINYLFALLYIFLHHVASLLHTRISNLSISILCIYSSLCIIHAYRADSRRGDIRRVGAYRPGAGPGPHGAAAAP